MNLKEFEGILEKASVYHKIRDVMEGFALDTNVILGLVGRDKYYANKFTTPRIRKWVKLLEREWNRSRDPSFSVTIYPQILAETIRNLKKWGVRKLSRLKESLKVYLDRKNMNFLIAPDIDWDGTLSEFNPDLAEKLRIERERKNISWADAEFIYLSHLEKKTVISFDGLINEVCYRTGIPCWDSRVEEKLPGERRIYRRPYTRKREDEDLIKKLMEGRIELDNVIERGKPSDAIYVRECLEKHLSELRKDKTSQSDKKIGKVENFLGILYQL